jgi:hypothetical protein
MKEVLRCLLGLGLAITVACPEQALQPSSNPAPAVKLTVRVYDFAGLSPQALRRAEDETSRLFEHAGVKLVWIDCPVSKVDKAKEEPCEEAGDSEWVRLAILPESKAKVFRLPGKVFGFAVPSHVYVFPDRVAELSGWLVYHYPVVLGMIMAHELGHSLLGDTHSHGGIMKRNLNRSDIENFQIGHLRFSANQTEVMRARLLRPTPQRYRVIK